MNTIGKLATAAVLALATTSGAATASSAPAAAFAPPWAEDVTYWLGGEPVGGKRYYCDGRVIEWGDTGNFDSETWNFWFECPS